MKKMLRILILFVFILLSSLCASAQNGDGVRYIDAQLPIKENAAPSRDGRDDYHFYYRINYSNDSSIYTNKMNPIIDELRIYKIGGERPFKTVKSSLAGNDTEEFILAKSDVDSLDQIQYAVRWEILNDNARRQAYETERRTLNINFDTDPALKVSIGNDRLYYINDINQPRLKIKSNRDGTTINNLVLRLQSTPSSTKVAELPTTVPTIINSNDFVEVVFESVGGIDLRVNTPYYLFGNFSNNGLKTDFPSDEVEALFQITNKAPIYIKPHLRHGTKFEVFGHSDFEEVLDASGDISDVVATLKGNGIQDKQFSLVNRSNERWELKIAGDPGLAFGTYTLEFTGIGSNGQSIQPSTFIYSKSHIHREVIQMDVDNSIYKVIAKFNSSPTDKVYLVIDGRDIEMAKSSTTDETYQVSFSIKDNTLQALSNDIKNSPDNKKQILITTKIDGYLDPSSLATVVGVIDVADLQGKNKGEIKKYLIDQGFQEGVKELANDIVAELSKDKSDRNWEVNIWSKLVELAPKAVPLILMAL